MQETASLSPATAATSCHLSPDAADRLVDHQPSFSSNGDGGMHHASSSSIRSNGCTGIRASDSHMHQMQSQDARPPEDHDSDLPSAMSLTSQDYCSSLQSHESIASSTGSSSAATTDSGSSSLLTIGPESLVSGGKPFRSFRSSEEYLIAMKEDLADWLNQLYDLDMTVDNFMSTLETGVVLCGSVVCLSVCCCAKSTAYSSVARISLFLSLRAFPPLLHVLTLHPVYTRLQQQHSRCEAGLRGLHQLLRTIPRRIVCL